MSKYILAALVLSLCISCSSDVHPIETKPLSQKNPIAYDFPGSVSNVRKKIITAFNDFDLMREFGPTFSPKNPSIMPSIESVEDAGFARHIFDVPENRDDLYIHFWGDMIDPSPIYFGGGKPLAYRAKFQLHLTALDDHRTRVSVITHDPSVINGSVCCGLHGYKSNDVPVEPTTVEEYKILLFIGRVLGVSGMPPLRLPED